MQWLKVARCWRAHHPNRIDSAAYRLPRLLRGHYREFRRPYAQRLAGVAAAVRRAALLRWSRFFEFQNGPHLHVPLVEGVARHSARAHRQVAGAAVRYWPVGSAGVRYPRAAQDAGAPETRAERARLDRDCPSPPLLAYYGL